MKTLMITCSVWRMIAVGVLGIACFAIRCPAQDNLARRSEIEAAMRRANEYYQSHYLLGTAVWNRGAYHGGNLRAFQMLGLAADRDYSISWALANNWSLGPESGGSADADAQACAQTYLDLYELDPQPVRKAAIKARYDVLVADPAADDDWWWIDAFYMAGPTFARLSRIENNPAYFTQLEQMYAHMKSTRGLFDPARGLWYRDATAKARTGANTPQFWGRGNGWVIAACARILAQLPSSDPRRTEFSSMLQTMAAALLPLQGADGFWRSNLLFPTQYSNPETSSTAFFTYALAYGVNEGLLDSAVYGPVVERAWAGLTTIALNAEGRLGYVQPIGAAPGAATVDGQQDYGYGAFMLLGCEMLRSLGGPAPVSAVAGANRSPVDLDANYDEHVLLAATASVVRDSSPVTYSWWLGSILLGEGPVLDVAFPLGSHTVTLQITHGSDPVYSDSTNVTVASAAPAAITVTAIGNQVGNTPQNTLDGSLATRWSQDGSAQWIAYQLPVTVTLDHVAIAFYSGDIRRSFFDLQLSTDGVNWTMVYSGASSGSGLGLETFSFPAQLARHVRYMGYGNSASIWNSLTEVSIPMPQTTDSYDGDADGVPDAWELNHLGTTDRTALSVLAGTGQTVRDAYITGADPAALQNESAMSIEAGSADGFRLRLLPLAAFGPGYAGKTRKYRVVTSTSLTPATWQAVPGYESISGDNIPIFIPVTASTGTRFYRAVIWLE